VFDFIISLPGKFPVGAHGHENLENLLCRKAMFVFNKSTYDHHVHDARRRRSVFMATNNNNIIL